jgi:hypothetical protein
MGRPPTNGVRPVPRDRDAPLDRPLVSSSARLRRASFRADESNMAKRSIRKLLSKKRPEKTALSPKMRDLMVSFEAKYGQLKSQDATRSTTQEPSRR